MTALQLSSNILEEKLVDTTAIKHYNTDGTPYQMNNYIKILPKKILIIRLSSLGDIIHCLPISYNLKKNYPQVKIIWLARAGYGELLQMHNCIDGTIELKITKNDRLFKKIKEIIRVIKNIRNHHFDVVLDLHCLLISNVIALLSGPAIKFGLDKKNGFGFRMFKYRPLPKYKKMHRINIYLSILDLLGLKDYEIKFPITAPLEAEKRVNSFLGAHNVSLNDLIITIHPGSSAQIKQWDANNFAKISSVLAEKYNAKIIIVYGAKEKHLAEIIKENNPADNVIMAPLFNIKELSALLKASRLFIGNDSGPLQLASAIGTPSIAIFGPSDPYLCGPYGDMHKIITKPVGCNPCYGIFYITFKCKNETQKCLRLLSVEEVLKEIDKIIVDILNIKNF